MWIVEKSTPPYRDRYFGLVGQTVQIRLKDEVSPIYPCRRKEVTIISEHQKFLRALCHGAMGDYVISITKHDVFRDRVRIADFQESACPIWKKGESYGEYATNL